MTNILFFSVYALFMLSVTGFCTHALKRDKKSFIFGTLSSLLGFLGLTGLLIQQVFTSGMDNLLLTNWLMAVIYYYTAYKTKNRLLGTAFMPIVLVLMTFVVFNDGTSLLTKTSYDGQFFLFMHQALLIAAFAIFFFTFAQSVTYLIKLRALKNHKEMALDQELPSLDRLQQVFSVSFNRGWSAMTVGIAFAVIYYFKKDSEGFNELKVIWGTVLWVIYTALFALYNTKKMNSRDLARAVTVLFIAFIIFYGCISTFAPRAHVQNVEVVK
ncbi:cytochrome c biogenesis protein CcsA [Lentisphaera profundi]|uniref:Cytochrome c biogenesis protein CcsA n=1 Tax=Lentisphaera profundi TaxID=1658616 RepID=A0ABY7VXD7_9BACT|nr:cytochrome c biogenesis protein CcsA [Lentisphaera profundi]WDE98762.1 cytochrome c biogenesis protein CcsA [Lentisphaera profundi]